MSRRSSSTLSQNNLAGRHMAKGLPCAAQTEALPCHDMEEYLIFAGLEVRERMLGLLLSMGVKFIKEDEEEGEEGDGGG